MIMGVANKMNKGGKFKFRFDEAKKDDIEYYSPEMLYNSDPEGLKPFVVRMMYINKKGHYGDQPALANEKAILNCPAHMLQDVLTFMNDDEIVEACDNGKLGVVAYKYDTENDKRGYSYGLRWVDIED